MKILVILMAGIGDALIATPLISELRANYPDAQIDALVRWRGARELLETNPNLNTVYESDLAGLSPIKALNIVRKLRWQGYDLSINPHPQSRREYRWLARMIGAEKRISHSYECRDWMDDNLITVFCKQDYSIHSIENNRNLLCVARIGRAKVSPSMEIHMAAEDDDFADRFVHVHRCGPQKWLGIHMGSGTTKNLAAKRWPLKNYLLLLTRLKKLRPDIKVFIFGQGDEQFTHQTCEAFGVVNVVTNNMRKTAAIIGQCQAFLSVDTALMHVASAMNVKHQLIIEAPTMNATNTPLTPCTIIQNPALLASGKRNTDFYSFDGGNIKGMPDELLKIMDSVTVNEVFKQITEKI